MYHPRYVVRPTRKRAFSEHYIDESANDDHSPAHRSDTDLIRIDKQRTFEAAHATNINTGDVLARVVQALGNIGMLDPDEGSPQAVGIHGFSDSQILAEESVTSSGCPTPPPRPRIRAVSDCYGYEKAMTPDQHEWTWNGTNEQIQELRNMRAKLDRPNDLLRQAVAGNSKQAGAHTINIEVTPPVAGTPAVARKSILSKILPGRLSPGVGDSNVVIQFDPPQDAKKYLETTGRGRESTNSLRKQYLNATSRGRPSIFTATESPDQDLLEKTTIADLIRALEVAHIQDNTPEGLLVNPVPIGHHSAVHGRRASMFPGFVNENFDSRPFEKERGKLEELQPVNKGHNGARRASMFPSNFKSFQRLTENILSDQFPPNKQLPVPPIPQPNGARRASMAPRRMPHIDRLAASPGRRVSLIPGAGRHAISERLLREYPHVPQETRELGHQQQTTHRSRPAQNFLNAPMGGAFALSLAAAHPGGISSTRRRSLRPSPLSRDQTQSASSPHLSVRHDSHPGFSPKMRNIRSVFRPFCGDDDRVPESANSEDSSDSADAQKKT